MIRALSIIVAIVAIPTAVACSTIDVKRVKKGADLTQEGLRYYLPQPFLVISPTASGKIDVRIENIADKNQQYAVKWEAFMSSADLKLERSRGLLTQAMWTTDTSAVAAEAAKAAGEVAKARIDAQVAAAKAAVTQADEAEKAYQDALLERQNAKIGFSAADDALNEAEDAVGRAEAELAEAKAQLASMLNESPPPPGLAAAQARATAAGTALTAAKTARDTAKTTLATAQKTLDLAQAKVQHVRKRRNSAAAQVELTGGSLVGDSMPGVRAYGQMILRIDVDPTRRDVLQLVPLEWPGGSGVNQGEFGSYRLSDDASPNSAKLEFEPKTLEAIGLQSEALTEPNVFVFKLDINEFIDVHLLKGNDPRSPLPVLKSQEPEWKAQGNRALVVTFKKGLNESPGSGDHLVEITLRLRKDVDPVKIHVPVRFE